MNKGRSASLLCLAACLIICAVPVTATATQYAYITNYGSGRLSVIDTASDTVVITTSPFMSGPAGVAVNSTGNRVYMTDLLDGKLYISKFEDKTIAPLSIGSDAFGVAVNQTGTRVYVSSWGSKKVAVVDTSDNSIKNIPFEDNLNTLAINPAGTRVYVAHSHLGTGKVSVIDTSGDTVIDTVNAGNNPWGVAVSPDGTRVYVTNTDGSNVSVIDTTTNPNTVIDTVSVGSVPRGIAVDPSGTRVYVANYSSSGTVSVIDTSDNHVVTTVNVGNYPYGVSVNPQGTYVYVTNNGSASVSVIATSNNQVVATIPVGTNPTAVGNFIGPEIIICPDRQVKLEGKAPYYSTIIDAYDAAASSGDSVLAEAMKFTGDLSLDSDKHIRLSGGYECDYASAPGWTTLQGGKLVISGGSAIVEKILIK
jgi:YVTN family beta-propeller protein